MKFLNKKLNKGFTLIELLVVISIIGLLSSVILASTSTVKAKGRDAARKQTVHQMDLAIKLYANDNSGNVPRFAGCGGTVSSCTATSGTTGSTGWTALTTALSPYIKTLPTSLNGIDYVYIAPTDSQDPSTYQISAKLEVPSGSNTQTGYSSSGTFVDITVPQTQTLTFTIDGPAGAFYGTGIITSSPSGFVCTSSTCTYSFPTGTAVTLTAAADSGSLFSNWYGPCTDSSSTCTFTMNGPVTAGATFKPSNPVSVDVWVTQGSFVGLGQGAYNNTVHTGGIPLFGLMTVQWSNSNVTSCNLVLPAFAGYWSSGGNAISGWESIVVSGSNNSIPLTLNCTGGTGSDSVTLVP